MIETKLHAVEYCIELFVTHNIMKKDGARENECRLD